MDLERVFLEFDKKFFVERVFLQDKPIGELVEEYWEEFVKEFNWPPVANWNNARDLVSWWEKSWDELGTHLETEVLEKIGVPKDYL